MRKIRLIKKSGFTLLEIVIVTAILGLVLAVALPNYRAFENRQILRNAAQLLTMDLKAQRQKANMLTVTCGIIIENNGYNIFQYSAPPGSAPPPTQTITKTISFTQIFNREAVITAPGVGTNISYVPANEGGNIPLGTVTLQLGGNSIKIKLEASGEIIIGEVI